MHQGRNINSGSELKKLIAGAAALLGVWAAAPTAARAASDPYFDMIIGENWTELDRLARERLAADPLDAQALHALGRLSLDSEAGSEQKRAEILPKIEACLAARPEDGLCRLAYGQVLGAVLSSRGMLDALGSVGRVVESFEAAVAADPTGYDARESLVTFYIRAPGIVGGSMRKAYRNADDYARIDPAYAKLLYALIALQEDDLPKAEAQLAALPETSPDPVLTHMIAKRWLAIGQAWLGDKDYVHARAAFEHGRDHGAPSIVSAAQKGLDRAARRDSQANLRTGLN